MTKAEQKELIENLYKQLNHQNERINKLEEENKEFRRKEKMELYSTINEKTQTTNTLKSVIYALITKQNPDIEKWKLEIEEEKRREEKWQKTNQN